MKNYQYNLNTVAWLAIIAIILALVLSSCKKDKQTEPEQPVTQSTIHYHKIAIMQQHDEASDIYVYGNGTMSTPIICILQDTVAYPSFSGFRPKQIPYIINGYCTISNNTDTLYLTYNSYHTLTNTWDHVINAKYLKQ